MFRLVHILQLLFAKTVYGLFYQIIFTNCSKIECSHLIISQFHVPFINLFLLQPAATAMFTNKILHTVVWKYFVGKKFSCAMKPMKIFTQKFPTQIITTKFIYVTDTGIPSTLTSRPSNNCSQLMIIRNYKALARPSSAQGVITCSS